MTISLTRSESAHPGARRRLPHRSRPGILPSLTASCLGLLIASHPLDARASPPPGPEERHALLVGCSTYPALPDHLQLSGPENDVVLLRHLLLQRGFQPAAITLLSEDEGKRNPGNLPTRANIGRELERLVLLSSPGARILLYLSGHGSLQPRSGSADGMRPGRNEVIFLPRDVTRWDGELGGVPNALGGGELGIWARRVTDKGAFLWVIVDACHSGTMVRGRGAVPDAVAREVPPEDLGIPGLSGSGTRGHAVSGPRFPFPTDDPRLVATYACRPSQKTWDLMCPLGPATEPPKRHGLFTYVLEEVLSEATGPLSYEGLADRIFTKYQALLPWMHAPSLPSPFSEGMGRDQVVLGTGPREDGIRADVSGGKITVHAGRLHGLRAGSILAVSDASSRDGTFFPALERRPPWGHVRITAAGLVESIATPCAFRGTPARSMEDVPAECVCRPVYVDYGIDPLAVYVTPAAASALGDDLAAISTCTGSMATIVEEPDVADWLVDVRPSPVPPCLLLRDVSGERDGDLDPHRLDDTRIEDPGEALLFGLQRIFRSRGLVAMAADWRAGAPAGTRSVDLVVELERFEDPAGAGPPADPRPVQWEDGDVRLYAGDVIRLRITNRGTRDADVTILFLDARFGITRDYPRPGTVGVPLPPGGSEMLGPVIEITDWPLGEEHLLILGIESAGPPVDLGFLEQASFPSVGWPPVSLPVASPEIGSARRLGFRGTRGSPRGEEPTSPAKSPSQGVAPVRSYDMVLVSWKTRPGPRPR